MSHSRKPQTANDLCFVTGSDSRYFPLLLELILSIRRFDDGADIHICVMDTGLTQAQRESLTTTLSNITVKSPEWPVDLPAKKTKGRDFLKSCICRPYIPDIFPGFHTYFWLDADTWVQDWRAIDLFLKGAETGRMACTMLVDRAFPKAGRMQFFGPLPFKPKSFYYSNAKKSLGYKTAQKLYGYNVVSAGAFALNADAPHWKIWQALIEKVLHNNGKIFTAEQLSLGVMAHIEGVPMEYLPSWCHWPFMEQLRYDRSKNCFTEPYLPYETLGILHLSGVDEMRLDRGITKDVPCNDGEVRPMSLRFFGFNGETGTPDHNAS